MSSASQAAGRPGPGSPPASPTGGGPGRPRRRLVLLLVIAAAVLALDAVTKVIVVATLPEGRRVGVLGDTVALELIRNPGAAFSLATGSTWILTLVAVGVVVGIVRIARRLRSTGWAIALALVLGGALGNLTDRFLRGPGPLQGHVVDFVSVGWWPVFNVADSSICVGGAVLVVLALLGREIDGTGAAADPADRTGSTSSAGSTAPTRTVDP